MTIDAGKMPGCVILSTFTRPRLDGWIEAHSFGVFTPHTITDAARYRDAVLAARELGYWSTDQYLNVGLRGVAVALRDRKGHCVGALSMTFQTQAYPHDSYLEQLLPALQDAAQAMRAVI